MAACSVCFFSNPISACSVCCLSKANEQQHVLYLVSQERSCIKGQVIQRDASREAGDFQHCIANGDLDDWEPLPHQARPIQQLLGLQSIPSANQPQKSSRLVNFLNWKATVMAFRRRGNVAAENGHRELCKRDHFFGSKFEPLNLTPLPTVATLAHTTNSCPNLKINVC